MKSLKKILLELVPVFLGVILALYFNNINEKRIERKKIAGLLTKVELGTAKNIQNLNMQLQQIQKVVDSLTHYQADTNLRIGDILTKAGGVRYIQFDLAAWNVLKGSELLVDVDYDLASLLYLLNESIADAGTIPIPFKASDPEAKEETIVDLSDYIGSIKHRIYLSKEIQIRLRKR